MLNGARQFAIYVQLQIKLYTRLINGKNETVICFIEVPFKAGLTVCPKIWQSIPLIRNKNILQPQII